MGNTPEPIRPSPRVPPSDPFARAPIALVDVDRTGTIAAINGAFERLSGYAAGELIGREAIEALTGRTGAEAVALRAALFGGERHEVEIALRKKDGTTLSVLCTTSGTARSENGVTLALRDLGPERERAERELRARTLAAIARLVSGVAHEINNPLTGVIGFSEVLLVSEEDPSRREALQRIVEEGHRVARVVRDLLVFARRQRPRRVEADLNETIRSAIAACRGAGERPEVPVEVDLAAGMPRFLFDEEQVKELIMHLFRNAEDAIRTSGLSGAVRVRSRRAGERAVVEIEDSGPGIPESDRERLFFPFFTTKAVGFGSGLGLAVAYGIALEHGGDLFFRPVAPHGALFVFELPIVRAEAAARPALPRKPEGPAMAKGARVLVIDDEASVRAFLRAALRLFRHDAVEATNAEEALGRLRSSGPFDVILLDVKMPGMGGEAFYETLVRERPDMVSRVVFQTGDTVAPETLRFVERSNRPLLSKPYTIEELKRAVGQVLVENAAREGLARPREE
jgi:PAS domain S-box-containing protein